MGKWIHILSEINAEHQIANCAHCGIVEVRKHGIRPNGDILWKCVNKSNEYNRTRKRFETNLKIRYGISEVDYLRLFFKQKGICAICKKKSPERKLSVDHDHETGQIRGLLCQPCNLGIGFLNDDPKNCLFAAQYLTAA